MTTIKLKDRPDIAQYVKLVSKKHSAYLMPVCSSVELRNTYWSEGSRSVYYLIDTRTKEVKTLPSSSPPQFGGNKTDTVWKLDPGFIIVEAGTFCGKPATPSIYMPS